MSERKEELQRLLDESVNDLNECLLEQNEARKAWKVAKEELRLADHSNVEELNRLQGLVQYTRNDYLDFAATLEQLGKAVDLRKKLLNALQSAVPQKPANTDYAKVFYFKPDANSPHFMHGKSDAHQFVKEIDTYASALTSSITNPEVKLLYQKQILFHCVRNKVREFVNERLLKDEKLNWKKSLEVFVSAYSTVDRSRHQIETYQNLSYSLPGGAADMLNQFEQLAEKEQDLDCTWWHMQTLLPLFPDELKRIVSSKQFAEAGSREPSQYWSWEGWKSMVV